MAQIHMIAGLTGAGKTTYARKLAKDIGGLRLSIDDWNANLFFMDRNPASDFNWFYDRVQRCGTQMREVAQQVLANGMPVIFDCGFTNRVERKIYFDWATGLRLPVNLHYIDVETETRWGRVQNRNTEQGDTFALEVTREMFDFMQNIWEAPTESEMRTYNGILVT
jgi:predicted kinase